MYFVWRNSIRVPLSFTCIERQRGRLSIDHKNFFLMVLDTYTTNLKFDLIRILILRNRYNKNLKKIDYIKDVENVYFLE